MSKNKAVKVEEPKSKDKMVTLNTKFDVTKVSEEMLRKKPTPKEIEAYKTEMEEWNKIAEDKRPERPKLKEEYSPAREITGQIILQAIKQVKPTGNIQLLKRTKNLSDLFAKAAKEEADNIKITEDDLRYIKSTLSKASDWNNVDMVATLVIEVMGLVEQAKVS